MNGRDLNGYDKNGWPALGLASVAIVVIWMLVLPWIGSRRSVSTRIEELDRRGIDPAALYYTDLEAMEQWEANIVRIRLAHPEAFWPGAFWPVRSEAAK